jgi:hypothetical protein
MSGIKREFSDKIPRMTAEEWLAEGKRRFGEDYYAWKFVCPICGHVQAVSDFERFKDDGASPDSAAQVCIGRYLPKAEHREAFGKRKTPEQPCNYAIFGLFCMPGAIVVHPDGAEQPVFAFADAAEAAAHA